MKVAFVGLGQMGKPMAMNLLKTVPGLMVSASGTSSFAAFDRLGGLGTQDRKKLAEADVLFLSLPNEAIVHEVLFGSEGRSDGISENMRAGSVVVDTSTIGYTATLDIEKALSARHVQFVDAPVSGMEARAVDGTLTAMCGGSESAYRTVEPLLASMASNILYMGRAGNGQLAKLVNQLLFDINCAALAEILPMALKLGLDPDKITAIVNSGTGKSHASEFFAPRILRNDFADGYPMKHAYKDLVSGSALSARLGIPLPVLAAATATYQTALLRGHGDSDKGAMIKVFEELLSVEFRSGAIIPCAA
jgi:3-hydroxyisobutyrate dehydrogenase-like beta-hydroxyacid dehydrogenase